MQQIHDLEGQVFGNCMICERELLVHSRYELLTCSKTQIERAENAKMILEYKIEKGESTTPARRQIALTLGGKTEGDF